jgi:hypothetical protein
LTSLRKVCSPLIASAGTAESGLNRGFDPADFALGQSLLTGDSADNLKSAVFSARLPSRVRHLGIRKLAVFGLVQSEQQGRQSKPMIHYHGVNGSTALGSKAILGT